MCKLRNKLYSGVVVLLWTYTVEAEAGAGAEIREEKQICHGRHEQIWYGSWPYVYGACPYAYGGMTQGAYTWDTQACPVAWWPCWSYTLDTCVGGGQYAYGIAIRVWMKKTKKRRENISVGMCMRVLIQVWYAYGVMIHVWAYRMPYPAKRLIHRDVWMGRPYAYEPSAYAYGQQEHIFSVLVSSFGCLDNSASSEYS